MPLGVEWAFIAKKGPVSLRNLLEKAIGHVSHHLPFIEQKKKYLASN